MSFRHFAHIFVLKFYTKKAKFLSKIKKNKQKVLQKFIICGIIYLPNKWQWVYYAQNKVSAA